MFIIAIQNIKEPKNENNDVHNCVWRTVDVFIRIWTEKITLLTIYVVVKKIDVENLESKKTHLVYLKQLFNDQFLK